MLHDLFCEYFCYSSIIIPIPDREITGLSQEKYLSRAEKWLCSVWCRYIEWNKNKIQKKILPKYKLGKFLWTILLEIHLPCSHDNHTFVTQHDYHTWWLYVYQAKWRWSRLWLFKSFIRQGWYSRVTQSPQPQFIICRSLKIRGPRLCRALPLFHTQKLFFCWSFDNPFKGSLDRLNDRKILLLYLM